MIFLFIWYLLVGRLACKLFEFLKRVAAAVKIQKHIRRYQARKTYCNLHLSMLVLQTGLRALAARKEFRLRKRTKAAIFVQVIHFKTYFAWKSTRILLSLSKNENSLSNKMQARWRCHKAASYYKKLKRGSIVTQCRWRGRIARRELRKLKMVSIIHFPAILYENIYLEKVMHGTILAQIKKIQSNKGAHLTAQIFFSQLLQVNSQLCNLYLSLSYTCALYA